MICVDASVAAKWVFAEDLHEQAEALYQQAIAAGERVVAPHLFSVEVTNIIRQRMRRPQQPEVQPLTLDQAMRHLERFLAFPVELTMPAGLHQRALQLAHAHGLSAVYDAHYVALAQLLNCELWTADRRLVAGVQGKLPFVRWIGDHGQPAT